MGSEGGYQRRQNTPTSNAAGALLSMQNGQQAEDGEQGNIDAAPASRTRSKKKAEEERNKRVTRSTQPNNLTNVIEEEGDDDSNKKGKGKKSPRKSPKKG